MIIYGGLGLGSWIGFLGLGFSVDGVWYLWCGVIFVFLRVAALCINIEEKTWGNVFGLWTMLLCIINQFFEDYIDKIFQLLIISQLC